MLPSGVRLLAMVVFGMAWDGSMPIANVRAQERDTRYDRAARVVKQQAGAMPRATLVPRWLPDQRRFWYRYSTGVDTCRYVLVDAVAATRKPAFDSEELGGRLNEAGLSIDNPRCLELDDLEFDEQGTLTSFRLRGELWEFDENQLPRRRAKQVGDVTSLARQASGENRATTLTFVNRTPNPLELIWLSHDRQRVSYGRIPPGEQHRQSTYVGHEWLLVEPGGSVLKTCKAREDQTEIEVGGFLSPNQEWLAFLRGGAVWLARQSTGEEFALSQRNEGDRAFSGVLQWSPDSRKLVAISVAPGQNRKVTLVESSPTDQLHSRVHSFYYDKPGDKLPHPRPCLFDVATRCSVPIDETLFPTPYAPSGILPIRWEADSQRFTFTYNQRGHRVFRVIGVNTDTGETQAIVNEECDTFFCYSSKQFLHWLNETRELIWMSERDGWNHLWLYDAAQGSVKQQITRGDWVVRSVEHVDEQARQIWFWASGIRAGEDPYHLHLCRIDFDGSNRLQLTQGEGTHSIQWSGSREYFVDTWSHAESPPVHELRRADGALIMELEGTEISDLLASGWRMPERFVAPGRDGVTEIHGLIYRPGTFETGKKYPVIEYIYAGPHGAFVPKEFTVLPGGDVRTLVELGFIVVQCDGMGTNWRSKAFHDVCWQNLGDSGFPDRIAWIRAAAEKYPELDLGRVGIYGGSAGGQSSTRALLAHGDFYHVAVSDCGCHDNRLDKLWWNEQWMGWPIGPHYAEQSNITQAHRLQGKLLLIVGEIDRNVDPVSTLRVADALVRADKPFELLMLPGVGHGAAETPYGKRRRAEFLLRHLNP